MVKSTPLPLPRSLWVLATPFVSAEYRSLWSAAFPPVDYALLPPAVASSALFLGLLARD